VEVSVFGAEKSNPDITVTGLRTVSSVRGARMVTAIGTSG
jgi:hypothetical protein